MKSDLCPVLEARARSVGGTIIIEARPETFPEDNRV
jgi:hypothetical protein